MEERHVTTGDGPSEAAQRLMDGIGVVLRDRGLWQKD